MWFKDISLISLDHALNMVVWLFCTYTKISNIFYKINFDGQFSDIYLNHNWYSKFPGIYQNYRQSFTAVLQKSCSVEFVKIHRKSPIQEPI